LGRSSSLPEKVGADFLMFSPVYGRVGVQRKTVLDLVASVQDGRFQRELIDMRGLDVAVWLFEGRADWTSDGKLLSAVRSTWTREQHFGLIFSIFSQGYWVLHTDTAEETCWCLSAFEKWLGKETHKGVVARPGPQRNLFGETDTDGWRLHFLQGLPGLGPERAKEWLECFGGLGMRLVGDPVRVAGVGKVTAKRIREVFE